ncbi:MAG: flippase, partial [Deltaproteobacteria bacterium]|nr:flippase [Deltaproteobacteria bacterium]
MSLLRNLVKNTVVLTAGRLSAKILGAVLVAFLARAVGPVGVGKYAFAGSLVAIFMLLPDFGFDTLLVRDVARLRGQGEGLIANILGSKLVLSVVALLLMFIFAGVKQYDGKTVEILVLVFLSGVVGSILRTLYSVVRSFERMEFEALLIVFRNVMLVVFGLTAIKLGLRLRGIIAALAVADILAFLFGVYITRRNFVRVAPKVDLSAVKKIFKAALPFGLLVIIEVVFINTDNLMIARFQGEMAVGWYSAAVKLLTMLLLIPHMFMNAIFPVLSRLSVSDGDSLRTAYTKSFSYLLMVAFPIGVGGFLVSDQVILFIYGDQFQNSILIFQVMIWVVVFSFVGFLNGATLNATGRERPFALMQGVSALSNVFLDYFLI